MTGLLNPSREIKFSGANADREIFIFPVQLTTCRIGNLTRLIHTLAICMTIHKKAVGGESSPILPWILLTINARNRSDWTSCTVVRMPFGRVWRRFQGFPIKILHLRKKEQQQSNYGRGNKGGFRSALVFFFFLSLISLIADGPHHYHPACGH